MDRLGPGVEAVLGQLLVQGHDLVLEQVGDPGRRVAAVAANAARGPRALQAVAAQQLEQPAGAHLVGRRQLLDRPPGPQVRLDQEPAHVHRSTPSLGGLLCLDTSPGQRSPMSWKRTPSPSRSSWFFMVLRGFFGFWRGPAPHQTTIEPSTRQFGLPAESKSPDTVGLEVAEPEADPLDALDQVVEVSVVRW